MRSVSCLKCAKSYSDAPKDARPRVIGPTLIGHVWECICGNLVCKIIITPTQYDELVRKYGEPKRPKD